MERWRASRPNLKRDPLGSTRSSPLILVLIGTGKSTTMGRLTLSTLMLLVSFLASGCHNATDATQGTSLPAPDNLSVSEIGDATTYDYTFRFDAVEFAQSYLI